MGQQYPSLSQKHIDFIADQKLFFVGTATADSRVNISPKGMDSFRVIDANTVAWLNVTGSGNETAAHVKTHPRMTIMFAAFEGSPMILRLYGSATAVHRNDAEWEELASLFPDMPGARQIFRLAIDLVQTSCGMAVPLFDYVGDRDLLSNWARKKGDEGIRAYWEEKNQSSIDGIATDILDKNG
ncbi:pyridoxamine 5'-phosphate oxidase family protein [Alcanivorax sp. S6407]|uniref:pyridoxamine 5'-phosphate oxidase family protein n=1 Tax=Alcanivorax sp. S6407 TaxID=2926424 RepID=UPI001FF270BE|nr:pyridoxamine 5'-phosphate oxidase family protein [Alcanivorax sp. S6407]MCK0155453.1 pyridoxamine 5'-phosphate oxidase family protein [Alcanivorax sp. S6407]